ncbi:MAG: hypothetical protein JWQ32_159 [Marmoricola sp.]|nr:hypothetical protein [Marmoricola sp.]
MDRIESYLADLERRLRLAPGSTQRLLEETAGHLGDAASAAEAAGVGRDEAEREAVARFGTAEEVAREANGGIVAAVGRLGYAAVQLSVVGWAAILAATLLAELLARVTSTAWVFGLPADATPTAGTIAHWLQVQPGAASWRDAAALENASDSLILRGGFTVIMLTTAALVLLGARSRVGRIERRVVPGLGLIAFGGTGLLLVVGGVTGAFADVEWGRGQWFCDAAVALLTASAFGVAWLRRTRTAAGHVLPISAS